MRLCSAQSLSAQYPLCSWVCQLCQDRVFPLPQSAQTLIKGQYRPGCNWKQIQPESPSSRNMLSTGKRLTFQKHELCKKKMRQNRNSTWSLLLPYMCRQRGREADFVLESCGPAMHDFICLSNCTQLTCMLLFSASIVKVKNKELKFQKWDHNVWAIWSTIKKD